MRKRGDETAFTLRWFTSPHLEVVFKQPLILRVGLIDLDYQEVGELPELGGVSDFDDLLVVNIHNLV